MNRIIGIFCFLALHFVHAQTLDYPSANASWINSCNYGGTRTSSQIDTWVIHYIGVGDYMSALNWFNNCASDASAHFIIRNFDGQVYQCVPVNNIAYHTGAAGFTNNTRSIGIEHDVNALNPSAWNSPNMVLSSIDLACYLMPQYNIPTTYSLPGVQMHNDMPGVNKDCPGPVPWLTWLNGVSNCASTQTLCSPNNDLCSNATTINVNGNCLTGDLCGATESLSPTSPCGNGASAFAQDIWFKFTPTQTGTYEITVSPSASMDAAVDIRTACSSASIACFDSGGGQGAIENGTFQVNSLSTHYIRVYHYTPYHESPVTSNFDICLSSNVVSPPPAIPLISGNNQICSGNSTTLSVTNVCGACSYLWSNGQTGASISVSSAGNYSVTASNSNGSNTSSNFAVTVSPTPNISIFPANPTYCPGSSVELIAGGANNYLWSTGQTTPSITVSSPGNYTVQGTNNFGCTGNQTVTVNQSQNLSVSVTASPDTITGSGGSSLQVYPSNATSYVWSQSALSGSSVFVTPSTTTTYTVTVTDVNGCVGIGEVTVYVDNNCNLIQPQIDTTNIPWVVSNINSNSSLQWMFNGAPILGANTPTLTPNTPGYYSVTVTDNSNPQCLVQSAQFYYSGISTDIKNLAAVNVTLFPNPTEDILNIIVPVPDYNLQAIVDLSGKNVISLVRTNQVSTHQTVVNTKALHTGLYYLILKHNNYTITKPFIKH